MRFKDILCPAAALAWAYDRLRSERQSQPKLRCPSPCFCRLSPFYRWLPSKLDIIVQLQSGLTHFSLHLPELALVFATKR